MFKYNFKISVFGNYNTGKTAFMHYLQDNKYVNIYEPTIGVEFGTKIVELEGVGQIKITFWDCAGQERFHSVISNFFKDVTAGILFFDVTDKKSYDSILDWVNKFRDNNSLDVPLLLVGNKIDKKDRAVSKKDAYTLATDLDLIYIETSVKEGININRAINLLVDSIYETKDTNPNLIEHEKTLLLHNDIKNTKHVSQTCHNCCIC